MKKKELLKQATALGLTIPMRWHGQQIKDAIDNHLKGEIMEEQEVGTEAKPEAKPKQKVKNKLKNVSNRPWSISMKILPIGDVYKLSESELSNEMTMAKIDRAVKIAFLKQILCFIGSLLVYGVLNLNY